MPSVVLITGVSRYVGGRLAAQLVADPAIDRVIGIDITPPRASDLPRLGRTEFVRADIRNPLIAKVMTQARVTAVGRVVLKSTAAVYGCGPDDPAVFTEDMHPIERSQGAYAKDAVEVEGYVRGFARRRPDVDTTILRLANLVPARHGQRRRARRAPLVADRASLRALDTTRLIRDFGYQPHYTTLDAVDSYLDGARPLARVAAAGVGVGSRLLLQRVRGRRAAVTGA